MEEGRDKSGKTHSRPRRANCGLIVIDIQERLLPAIVERERVIQNTVRLIKGMRILGVPTIATEQYRKGLGATVPEVREALGEIQPIEKVAFSACGAAGVNDALNTKDISDVILCGIEAHVCVSQTGLDLLAQSFRVFLAADAVSSRNLKNYRIGVERLRDAGAVIVSTEMVLFELLERAGTEEFKQILALVK
jgi:nicotinamidase-related amidase